MEDTIKLAKTIITEEVEKAGCIVSRILLFGSRARGDFRSDSDWDFFVIVDKDLPYSERSSLCSRIRLLFVQAGFFGDVFIGSEGAVQKRKNNTGFLDYYVLKEGVEI
jgi:predicted nucleotidyltransferase